MRDVKTYITYFDDNQIEEYHLKEDDNTTLFKGNDISYSGESINHLNTFYCELCTMYYIWKNNLQAPYICLKQYRRMFDWESIKRLPGKGEVICYKPLKFPRPIIFQYAICHGSKRASDLMKILKSTYGSSSQVYNYFLHDTVLYTNNSMVLLWDDFVKLCEFVFGVLDKLDKVYELDYDYGKYKRNAKIYTEDGRFDYQEHWVAYIGERLVSCYIRTNLKALTIPRLENNGFYKPYKPQK